MTPANRSPLEQLPAETRTSLARLHARAWGIASGLLFGFGLFSATIILVLKQGPNVGEHLSLLSVFLPGYSVSFAGALIGFVYAFVIGYAVGRVISSVYNLALRDE